MERRTAEHITLAAQALAYGAMWRTGAPAYDVRVKEGLRLQPGDAIIGIIYIGTPGVAPRESPRPDLGDFVTRWRGWGSQSAPRQSHPAASSSSSAAKRPARATRSAGVPSSTMRPRSMTTTRSASLAIDRR